MNLMLLPVMNRLLNFSGSGENEQRIFYHERHEQRQDMNREKEGVILFRQKFLHPHIYRYHIT